MRRTRRPIAIACLLTALVALAGQTPAGAGPAGRAGDPRGLTHGYETPNPPAGADEPVVSLTFDDGPHPQFTSKILEILRRYGVRATFFELGSMAERHPELVREVVAGGNVIANHTWMHRDLPRLSEEEFAFQIDHTTRVLESLSGQPISCVRPPRGRSDATVIQRLANRHLAAVVWTADSRDFAKPGVDAIVYHALAGLQPGSVILMHDAGGNRDQTIAALPAIIEGILARGYRIEPICGPDLHRPTGTLDLVSPEGAGQLRVAGQASDPDTAEVVDVHVYLDGAFAAAVRADGAGSGTHEYNTVLNAPPGAHEVCTYVLNVGPGDANQQLGCLAAEVAPPRTVLNVVDELLARLRSATIRGQTASIDAGREFDVPRWRGDRAPS